MPHVFMDTVFHWAEFLKTKQEQAKKNIPGQPSSKPRLYLCAAQGSTESTNMRLQRPLVLLSLISTPKTSKYFTQLTQDQTRPGGPA